MAAPSRAASGSLASTIARSVNHFTPRAGPGWPRGTDRAGARLSVPRYRCDATVRTTLRDQQKHGVPVARVSRFAAISLGLQPDSRRFRAARALIAIVAVAACVAALLSSFADVIPALAR
jgi:hypothetical protein